MTPNTECALRLHRFMLTRHWDGGRLIGPDSGIRINLRLTRFVKGYLSNLDWHDSYYYLQAQGYWILGNWRLYRSTGLETYRDLALRCSDSVVAAQRTDGSWIYPNPEWKGRIATAEGTWASIGLLESKRQTGDTRYLDAVINWHRFLLRKTGFLRNGDELAINYFAGQHRPRIPNNSAFVVRFLAELTAATGDHRHQHLCPGLLTFLAHSQLPHGELPYAVDETSTRPIRPHYQCYQYNAFECLDLLRYYDLTNDRVSRQIVLKLLPWLETGIDRDGHVRFSCSDRHRRVYYHATAVAAALATATSMQLGDYGDSAERSFAYVRGLQRDDGSFAFSTGDYRVLSDLRSYPRSLAMMLFHLLTDSGAPVHSEQSASLAHCSV